MNFHEVRFPAPLSMGSSGGPERRTEIVTLSNGFEERNTPWAHSRRRYDAGLGVRSLDDLAAVISFFEERRGRLYGFRWKDWSDYKSCKPSSQPAPGDQSLGTGDGERREFALKKAYGTGFGSYERPVTKPVEGTVRVALSGEEQPPSAFWVNLETGMVTLLEAPASEAIVTAGFEFDVPVRFDTDKIAASLASLSAGEIPSIPIVEVRI